MNRMTKLLAAGIVSLLPLQALAADASAPTGELHGFDKYWSMVAGGKDSITKDEWMKRAANHFDEIDANHDGKITKDEMQSYDQERYKHRMQMLEQHQNKQ